MIASMAVFGKGPGGELVLRIRTSGGDTDEIKFTEAAGKSLLSTFPRSAPVAEEGATALPTATEGEARSFYEQARAPVTVGLGAAVAFLRSGLMAEHAPGNPTPYTRGCIAAVLDAVARAHSRSVAERTLRLAEREVQKAAHALSVAKAEADMAGEYDLPRDTAALQEEYEEARRAVLPAGDALVSAGGEP